MDAEGGIDVGAAGIRDARTGRLLSADDRVHIGSVTKTVLALGVLRLASEGRLRLDTPVYEVLPDLDVCNPWAPTDPVRIRHLLDHTSGLDDLRLWQFFSLEPDAGTPLSHAFAGKGLLRVRSRPGTRFSYSNMGYALLGRVIESVTGERYEHYLDAHLLRALGMRDSTFGFVAQDGMDGDPRLAMGHFDDGTPHGAVPIYLRPAGQFTTTAHDMARLARFLMGDGRVAGETFIEPAWLRSLGRPAGTDAARVGLIPGYGLGLATRDRNGAVGLCHGGNIIGYRAMLCLFPGHRRAYFWSVNTDSETARYERLDALFVDALGVTAPATAPSAETTEDLIGTAWDGLYVPAPNRMAKFAWVDTVFGVVRVRRDGRALRFDPLQGDDLRLEPMGGALFRAPGRTIASHALLREADGNRVISTGWQSYERVETGAIVALWASLLAGLAGFVHVLASGLARFLARRLPPSHPVFFPFVGSLLLILPLPLFWRQPFLQLGDLTLASGALAATTALLPVAMAAGLFRQWFQRRRGALAWVDALAMLAVLQWTVVLACWGLWPARLWV